MVMQTQVVLSESDFPADEGGAFHFPVSFRKMNHSWFLCKVSSENRWNGHHPLFFLTQANIYRFDGYIFGAFSVSLGHITTSNCMRMTERQRRAHVVKNGALAVLQHKHAGT